MSYYQSSRSSSAYSSQSYGYNSPQTAKWWTPKDEKARKTFDNYKSDIKTVLTVCTRGISTRKAYEEFAEQMDGEISYKDLGFKNFGELLFHCDDVLEVRSDGTNGYYIFLRGGRVDEDTEHLRSLVVGQSKSTKYKGFKARVNNTRPVSSDVLLNVMRRSEPLSGMSNNITRPSSGYGSSNYNSYYGRGRGRGGGYNRGGRGGSTSSSGFTPGINGIPKLVAYNGENDHLPPSDNSRSNSEYGRGTGAFQNSSMEPLPPTMGYMKVRSSLGGGRYGSSGKEVRPGLLNAVLSRINDDDDSDNDDMEEWTWSSSADTQSCDNFKAVAVSASSTPFEDPQYWSDGEDIVDNVCNKSNIGSAPASNGNESLSAPKEVKPMSTLDTFTSHGTNSRTSSQIQGKVVGDIKSEIVKSSQTTQLPSSVVTATEHLVQPLKSTLLLSQTVSSPSVNNPVLAQNSSQGKAASSTFATPPTPAKPTNPFRPPPPETKIMFDESRNPAVVSPSSLKSMTIPKLNLPWHQMKMPIVENFNAKLLGVDGFGFIFIQLNDPAINKGFDELQRSLQDFYLPEKLSQYRVDPADMVNGLMVVAKINGAFARANIYETDIKNKFCILVDLEEHDFHFVDLKDIYRIDNNFRSRRPRAIMCTLAGLEPFMMTQEITDAFEVTPLHPPDVKVTLKSPGKMFKVPVVTMTIGDGRDVMEAIKFHGRAFLKEFNTQLDRQSRKDLQNVQLEILERINYFPTD